MMQRALLEYVINALWQVPLLAGGAWLLLRMVRPSPLVQHHVWLAVLGLAVLLPVHGLGFRGVSATRHTAAIAEASRKEFRGSVAQNELPWRRGQWSTYTPLLSARTGNLRLTTRTAHWLFRLYVATMIIGLFRITRAWLATRRLVRNSQAVCLGNRDRKTLEDYSHRLGIKPPELRESGEVSSPMIIGVREPFLVLPEGFARHTENEIRAAFCHELAHIQRRDYLFNVACRVAALPLVWHPIVEWVQQRIHMTREMVCDAMAAQEMKSQLGYAKCLLALAHSMLGERGMAAQGQFLGLFGNHTLEERVMRLMDTTTLSVRAKVTGVVSGTAMMIAAGVIAGMFHVTPTMAQANVLPQATQNPPAEAQAPVPKPKAGSPSAATQIDTTPATPKKQSYIHRNGGGQRRKSSPIEQPLIDQDSQQRLDDLARQTADVGPKVNSPEFKQRMDDLRRQMADAGPKINSPEFKQQMDDLRRQMADVGPKINSPEFKQQIDDLQRQMADVGPKINSLEFKQRMDDLQKEMQKQMEEFSRKYPHSLNP